MFRIKSFQRRILLALLAFGLVPTGFLLLAGTYLIRSGASSLGTAGPWGSVAESGQQVLEQVDSLPAPDASLIEAAAAHRRALSEGLRGSRVFALLLERALPLLPLIALALALIVGGLAYWAARQLSRGFSRPIADLVEWTRIIGHGDPLPDPGPSETRGVQEFAHLREALRRMALELDEGRRQAIQATKLRSWTDMARRVAHEMKNPLTPMRMAAFSVSRVDDSRAREAGEVILEEIQRLDEMARTFAQFGRMPEGPPSGVDVGELLEGLAQQHAGAGATIQVDADEGLPLVLGHFDALERCFRNLLLNALDAAGPEGRVEIRVRLIEGGILALIRDSGPGIPPEDLERIWEPDFTTKSKGTGLGLPMVQQTILAHHGRVEGQNDPDGGAVFQVVLPLEPHPSA